VSYQLKISTRKINGDNSKLDTSVSRDRKPYIGGQMTAKPISTILEKWVYTNNRIPAYTQCKNSNP
jgi:hypothetical protein